MVKFLIDELNIDINFANDQIKDLTPLKYLLRVFEIKIRYQN